MESGHLFSERSRGSHRSPSTKHNNFYQTYHCNSNRCPFRFLTFADPFKIERRRAVSKIRRPFKNSFLSNVVASHWSILHQYHTFSSFIFETCNLLFPEVVAVKKDGAAELQSHDRLGLRTSPPGTKLKSTVITKCCKQGEEVSKQLSLSPLLRSLVRSPRFCQSPGPV